MDSRFKTFSGFRSRTLGNSCFASVPPYLPLLLLAFAFPVRESFRAYAMLLFIYAGFGLHFAFPQYSPE